MIKSTFFLVLLVFSSHCFCQREEDSTNYWSIKYFGEYTRLIVKDRYGNILHRKKKSSGQTIILPHRIKEKFQKEFFIHVNDYEYRVKIGCNKKQLQKAVEFDLFRLSSDYKKKPCIISRQTLEIQETQDSSVSLPESTN